MTGGFVTCRQQGEGDRSALRPRGDPGPPPGGDAGPPPPGGDPRPRPLPGAAARLGRDGDTGQGRPLPGQGGGQGDSSGVSPSRGDSGAASSRKFPDFEAFPAQDSVPFPRAAPDDCPACPPTPAPRSGGFGVTRGGHAALSPVPRFGGAGCRRGHSRLIPATFPRVPPAPSGSGGRRQRRGQGATRTRCHQRVAPAAATSAESEPRGGRGRPEFHPGSQIRRCPGAAVVVFPTRRPGA